MEKPRKPPPEVMASDERCDFGKLKVVEKGWGREVWIWNREYCGKQLFFDSGKKCSWHYHHVKDEVFFLHSGKVQVRYGYVDDLGYSETVVMNPGDKMHMPRGMRHQITAIVDSLIYEFSTHHVDEDSIKVIKGD